MFISAAALRKASLYIPPDPTERQVLINPPGRTFDPQTNFQAGILYGAGLPHRWRWLQHDPVTPKSELDLVEAPHFGYVGSSPAKVMRVHMWPQIPGDVDVGTTAGWRAEGGHPQGANGQSLQWGSGVNRWCRISFYFPSATWPSPVQGFCLLSQAHTGIYPKPAPQWTWAILLTPEDIMRFAVQGGPNTAATRRDEIIYPAAIPKDAWLHVAFRLKVGTTSATAETEIWRWFEGVDATWVHVRTHSSPNNVSGPSGNENPYHKGGLYGAGENTGPVINPLERTHLFTFVEGDTFDSIKPFSTAPVVPPTPVTAAPPAAVTQADPGVWSLVFEDDFTNGLDFAKWSRAGETGPVSGDLWTDKYGAMDAWEPNNVFVRDNKLVLRTTKAGGLWNGGMVHQRGLNLGWTYGYFEVKWKPPVILQNAFLAPFWMMHKDVVYGWWPNSGEIDVAEIFGHNLPNESEIIYSTLVYRKNDVLTYGYPGNYREIGVALSGGYHISGLHWFRNPNNANKITLVFLRDGVIYGAGTQDLYGGQYSSTAPFDVDFYLLMGIHAGIGWGDVDAGNGVGQVPDAWSGSELLIDHVRIWQRT